MHVIRIDKVPDSGSSYLFDGSEHDAPVSFLLLHTPPGEGPGLHRHSYAETFVIQEGRATFTVGDQTIEARAPCSAR